MSWIADLLKDIPLSVVLKEKISLIELKFEECEKKSALLQTENEKLKVTLLEAQKENEILKTQLRIDAESENLDENALQIIRLLSQKDGRQNLWELEEEIQLSKLQLQHSLDFLEQHSFLESRFVGYTKPTTYELTQKGRKYALEKGLARSQDTPNNSLDTSG